MLTMNTRTWHAKYHELLIGDTINKQFRGTVNHITAITNHISMVYPCKINTIDLSHVTSLTRKVYWPWAQLRPGDQFMYGCSCGVVSCLHTIESWYSLARATFADLALIRLCLNDKVVLALYVSDQKTATSTSH